MVLVDVIQKGLSRAFNTELVAVMRLLANGESRSPSQIAAALAVPRSSVTGRIQELQHAGQIEIEPDPADGRSYRVRLTLAGQTEIDALILQGRQVFAGWVSDWTSEEIRTFSALARRLTIASPQPSREPAQRTAWWKGSRR